MKSKNLIILAISILVFIIGYFYFEEKKDILFPQVTEENWTLPPDTSTVVDHVEYACAEGKRITATFYSSNSVKVVFSENSSFRLSRVLVDDESGETKFANGDSSVVFWVKEDSSFLQEKGKETYKACRRTPAEFPQV
jgi:membrane-bound inhibitor of C-type lysozyme